MSLVLRSFEGDLAEACAPCNANIGLLAYGCLAGGTLTGKYQGGQRPAGARHTEFPGGWVDERAGVGEVAVQPKGRVCAAVH